MSVSATRIRCEDISTICVDDLMSEHFCMAWLRETTVNDHEFAVSFYGILAVAYVYGYVAVDDVAIVAYYVESIKDIVYYLLVVA